MLIRALRSARLKISMPYFAACFFFARRFFKRASFLANASFGTLKIARTALSKRSHGVFPGTSGVGNDFIPNPLP
jgi:hypothetical protein